MAVKKPLAGVASLAVKRGANDRKLTATWKVPSSLTKGTKKADPATKLTVTWSLGIAGKDPKKVEIIKKLSDHDSMVNLDAFNAGKKSYNRNSFYPMTTLTLASVTCAVVAANKGGSSPKKPSTTYKFVAPDKPVVGSFSMNSETGVVSATITAAASSGTKERYDTEYYFTVKRSDTGQTLANVHNTFTGATQNLSYNLSGYQSLPVGAYVQFYAYARSRGYAGASAWTTPREFYVSRPNVPTISKVSVPSKRSQDRVTATIKTEQTKQHPVTAVQLQALADVAYATREEVEAASAQWQDVGAPDDGSCTALSCLVEDVLPATAGNHSWVRVKSWYLVEDALVSYSRPEEVKDLYVPATTVTADSVVIIDAQSGEDGTTALVTLAWAPTGTTDTSDGTELSWSDQPDTWRSTDDPETYEVTYDDGHVTHGGVSYQSSATIAIKGLDEGATTYIKARRYKDGDSGLVYGPYGDMATVIPSVAPASVVLDVPGFVPEGSGITCTWTFSGGSPQTAWQLLLDDGTVIAEGTDAMGAATIPADRAASLATGGALTIGVAVSTGGAWVQSTAKTVNIVPKPTFAVTPSATYTAQGDGIQIPATCSAAGASVALTVTSRGTSGDGPAGMVIQATGDVIWSGVVLPEWSGGAASIRLPAGLDFVDGTEYQVTATATDPATGLVSEQVTATFGVAWSHQAPDPDGCVTLTPIDTYDTEGNSVKAVRIDLVPPSTSVATDCYDIYRLTNDGAQLIGETWPLTASAIDQYAPYGDGMEHYYRIACRTADGDVEWYDAPYEMGGGVLRFDWSGGMVELPYDLAISDGYGKDVDVHEYLDGSTDAFYNQGISRTAKLATTILRLDDPDTIAAVKELARFVGPAFVRTPDGSAYEAHVEVTDMTPTHELSSVSISATEVNLTPAYMLPTYNVEDETEG